MNVAVIGSGGRENAITWALKKSPIVKRVYTLPGNGGTVKYGDNILIDPVYPYADLIDFLNDAQIDLTVVGPENPLCEGIVDILKSSGHRVFGPRKKAARLENSKVFMKEFMDRHGIPTAKFRVFSDAEEAYDFVRKEDRPFVVKTDGLAAGKGALVNFTVQDTLHSIRRILVDREFGESGDKIVVEDLLEGMEVSVFILTDGVNFKWLASAQDHKRIFDDDKGPNTGGMGAYAPAAFLTEDMKQRIIENIVRPTIDGMRKDGNPYEGFLYVGLMLTKSGPVVIEYNVRLGDPEAQVVLPLLKTDLARLCLSVCDNRLEELTLETYPGFCAGVVMASGGYPGKYEKGFEITGNLKDEEDRVVFHAGTKRDGSGKLFTNGGRVLCVSALAPSLKEAIDKAYAKVMGIDFEKKHYRHDIGAKGLKTIK